MLLKKISIPILIVMLALGTLNAQTTISTAGPIGSEVVIDDFGHISSKINGTATATPVQWHDYSSKFLRINNMPLVEIKEGVGNLNLYDGIPASPTGTPNGFFFPDLYDDESWTFVPGVNEHIWHSVVEYDLADNVHIIGGIGYRIDDPGQLANDNWVDLIHVSQFTNVGMQTVTLAPFHYERMSGSAFGQSVYSNADLLNYNFVQDYDGLFGTSDDYIYSQTSISMLPHMTFAGFPMDAYKLNDRSNNYLAILQNSGNGFDLISQTATNNGNAEITFQYDEVTLEPGQTAVYWLYPKVLKMWNTEENHPTDIDYHIQYIDQLLNYSFFDTDVFADIDAIEYTENALTGAVADTSKLTVVEVTGGMIDSDVPENIGFLHSKRYWEIFFDTRRASSTITYSFEYSDFDEINNLDSLTLLYRTNYDQAWTEYPITNVNAGVSKIYAVDVPFGDAQWVLAERGGFIPEPAELISVANGADSLWYNPELVWQTNRPANYILQVADNMAFIEPAINKTFLVDSEEGSYQIVNADLLEDHTTYYWRVRAFNDFGNAAWSDIWSFDITFLNWEVLPRIMNNFTEMNATSTFFLNADTGYVTGDDTKITVDGGLTWTHQTNLSGVVYNDIFFINDTTEFIVGGDGEIRTYDGVFWNHIENPYDNGWYKAIDFPGTKTGYIVGELATAGSDDPALLKSTNGGNTWEELASPIMTDFEGVSFANDHVGVVVGINNSIIKTINGGADWDILDLGLEENHDLYDVAMPTINDIYVTGTNGLLIVSHDGGNTWEKYDKYDDIFPGSTRFTSVFFIDENNGYVTGDVNNTYQIVLRTINGGEFWGIQNSNVEDSFADPVGLDDVFFSSPFSGYAVGYNGTAIKYTLPGQVVVPPAGVVAVPELNVMPGGEVTMPMLASLENGVLAESLEFEFEGFYGLVDVIDVTLDNTIIGDNEWLLEYNVIDGKLKIAAAGSDEITGEGNLFNIKFAVPEYIAVDFVPVNVTKSVFNDGSIELNTYDGGLNIVNEVLYGDANMDGVVQALDASHILKYLAGDIPADQIDSVASDVSLDMSISSLDASLILKFMVGLIDSLPYSEGQFTASGSLVLQDVNFVPASSVVDIPVIFEAGENILGFETVYTFDPEKVSFNEIIIDEDFPNILKEVQVNDGSVKIVGASTGAIDFNGAFAHLRFEILDGFEDQTTITLSSLRLNENNVMSDVSESVISSLTSMKDVSLPTVYSLDQNYPNPFNPATVIRFALPVESKVTVTIYNSLGQKLEDVVSASFAAGIHNVNYNASKLASGIYIYQITAVGSDGKNFVDTKKMMLMK